MAEIATKTNILIVDDDKSVSRTLLEVLERSGHNVNWVPTGNEALDHLRKWDQSEGLNLIIIDIRLPDINGVELLKKVRRGNPDVSAIMMTGYADIETAVTSLNEGAFGYMQKPYNMDEFNSMIDKVFEKQRLVKENKALVQRLQEMNEELERTVHDKTAELKSKNLILLEVVEKLKVLNELKSRFVANASHELQTPITSILGFSSMLLDYWDKFEKSQVTKFLQIIRDEAQRLTRSSRDLLDLSRIQDGRMNLQFKEVDLRDIAEKVRENMKMVKESVRIDCEFDEEARLISSDADKLQQVFTNIVGNAIKYSPNNSQVRITGKRKGNIVIVSVLDQGPGIPMDKREKVFEPFYRIHDDVGKKVRGTGLGLPIAKAIVEALGGSIRVEGEVGKGSNFTFILPGETLEGNGKREQRRAKS